MAQVKRRRSAPGGDQVFVKNYLSQLTRSQAIQYTKDVFDVAWKNPSALCSRRNWKRLQFPRPEFFCYRGPQEARPQVPVRLRHPSFAELGEAIRGTLEEEDILLEDFLWTEFSRGFDNEADMKEKNFYRLNHYLGVRIVTEMQLQGCPCDGLILNEDNPRIMFEMKTEMSAGDPCFELLAYIQKWVEGDIKSRMERSLVGLCVSMVSPYVQVAAFIYDSQTKRLDMEPLTDMICIYGPQQNKGRVASLFRGLKVFRTLNSSITGSSSIPFPLWGFNDVQTLDAESLVYKFCDGQGKQKVAKFVVRGRYGLQAHRVWAGLKMAPMVQDPKPVNEPFYLIVMDCLEAEDGWKPCADVVRETKEMQDLRKLAELRRSIEDGVKKCHAAGYVHGDLRLSNLMVKEGVNGGDFQVMAVDFDWAGEEGKATYPMPLNPDIVWHPDAKYGAQIRPDHDLWFVGRLTEQLNEV